jgi:hypothetical protein
MEKENKSACLKIFINLRILSWWEKSEHNPIKTHKKAVYRGNIVEFCGLTSKLEFICPKSYP